jgi:LytS/YehU family sensor histidine kinase
VNAERFITPELKEYESKILGAEERLKNIEYELFIKIREDVAKETVKLQDEIDYLNNYIELHKIRYRKSVKITFNHNIDTGLTVAPLLYIILLENAFKHGVETLAENAFIHIDLYEKDNFIHFDIENNFDPSEIKESDGIGLKNLKRRLSLIYENDHELLVESKNNSYKTTLKISKHA